jgi:hypothetical protein
MSVSRFLRKPVEVEAIQFTGGSQAFEVGEFVRIENIINLSAEFIRFNSQGEDIVVSPTDWVVKQVNNGELSSYTNELFVSLFEAFVEE